jgi:hypothetical protein
VKIRVLKPLSEVKSIVVKEFVLGYRLHVFAVDGAIAEKNTSALRIKASEYFAWLRVLQDKGRTVPSIALATNQPSVGWRYWAQEDSFVDGLLDVRYDGGAAALPSQTDVHLRLLNIQAQIPLVTKLYVNYVAKSDNGRYSPTPLECVDQPEWSRSWRKPNPGMVNAAINYFNCYDLSKVLVVGGEDDRLSAKGAGVQFMSPHEFWYRVEKEQPALMDFTL